MARRILTLADARDEKRDADMPGLARAHAIETEARRVEAILQANPAIGVLGHGKARRYYVNFPTFREARDPAALIAQEG